MVDIFIEDWINVSAAALYEKRHRAWGEVVFDHLRSEPHQVGGITTIRDTLDGMASKVVNDGQGLTGKPIDAQNTDLWIDRPHAFDLIVRGQGVRVPNIEFASIFQTQSSILHDPIFVTCSRADRNRRQRCEG